MCFFTCSLSSIWWDVNVCFNWTLCLCERCHKTLYTAECLLLACVLRGHVTQFEYRAWSECCLGSLYCNNSSVMITVKKKQYIIHCFRVIKNRLCPLKSRVNSSLCAMTMMSWRILMTVTRMSPDVDLWRRRGSLPVSASSALFVGAQPQIISTLEVNKKYQKSD